MEGLFIGVHTLPMKMHPELHRDRGMAFKIGLYCVNEVNQPR
jgi:hypothetical protein